jgi:hypothetical protein
VSATFVDGIQALRRREALGEFLRMSGAPPLSPQEVAEIIGEIRGTASPPKRRAKATRAA